MSYDESSLRWIISVRHDNMSLKEHHIYINSVTGTEEKDVAATIQPNNNLAKFKLFTSTEW